MIELKDYEETYVNVMKQIKFIETKKLEDDK